MALECHNQTIWADDIHANRRTGRRNSGDRMQPINFELRDINPDVVNAWRKYFRGVTNVSNSLGCHVVVEPQRHPMKASYSRNSSMNSPNDRARSLACGGLASC